MNATPVYRGRMPLAGPVPLRGRASPERRPGRDGRRGDRFRVLYAYPERTTGRSAYPTRNRKRPIRARPDEPETRRGTDGPVNTIREATRILRYLPAYLKRHRAARVILAHTWRLHRSPGRAARRTGGARRAVVRVESASDSECVRGSRDCTRSRDVQVGRTGATRERGRRDSRLADGSTTMSGDAAKKPNAAPIPRSCSAPGARGQTVNGRKR